MTRGGRVSQLPSDSTGVAGRNKKGFKEASLNKENDLKGRGSCGVKKPRPRKPLNESPKSENGRRGTRRGLRSSGRELSSLVSPQESPPTSDSFPSPELSVASLPASDSSTTVTSNTPSSDPSPSSALQLSCTSEQSSTSEECPQSNFSPTARLPLTFPLFPALQLTPTSPANELYSSLEPSPTLEPSVLSDSMSTPMPVKWKRSRRSSLSSSSAAFSSPTKLHMVESSTPKGGNWKASSLPVSPIASDGSGRQLAEVRKRKLIEGANELVKAYTAKPRRKLRLSKKRAAEVAQKQSTELKVWLAKMNAEFAEIEKVELKCTHGSSCTRCNGPS